MFNLSDAPVDVYQLSLIQGRVVKQKDSARGNFHVYLDVFSSFKIPLNNDDDDYKEGGCLRATERIEGETSLPSYRPFYNRFTERERERGKRERVNDVFTTVLWSLRRSPPSLPCSRVDLSFRRPSVRPSDGERAVRKMALAPDSVG